MCWLERLISHTSECANYCVCSCTCVVWTWLQLTWLWPVSISLFALQGAVQVCKEWSHSSGPKGETNRLLVALPVAVMCDFTKKLVTWYHWRLLYLLSPRALPNFRGCPLSLQNPSCPLFSLPSHPTPLPFPSSLFPLPSHPHTSPPHPSHPHTSPPHPSHPHTSPPHPSHPHLLTSVMIYHRGTSLSEQHNEFLICLICHCTKAEFACHAQVNMSINLRQR